MHQNDDLQLFARIASGDEQAFTELFHRYTPKLLPFTKRLTKDPEQSKELIQETFLQLWINRDQLTEVENPAGWIFRIASNLSLNWVRNEANRRRILQQKNLGSSEKTNAVITEVEAKQLSSIIHRAVEALPEKRRQIYRYSREAGLSHQQIAERLGLSTNTVKNQIGIALRFIQEFISKETGLSLITLAILFRF